MSRVTFFFSQFFFLEKVIIDGINVIKTKKKNLKKQMAREHLLVIGWGGGWNREKPRDIPICFRRITFVTPGNQYHEQNTLLENTDSKKKI